MAELRRQVHNIGRRRAWVIWFVSLSVYVLAVFHRSSLGVAGLVAADRFDIAATQLSAFTVLQLLVYAGMQIPVGILLDRFGSRLLLLAGLALMTGGQFAFAYADSFGAAVGARVLVGAGDAMVFTSVLRIVTLWFRIRQAPLITQLTGQLGQVGAVVAAAPLSAALAAYGWTRTFALGAVLGVPLVALTLFVVKDSPYRGDGQARVKIRAMTRSVRSVWGSPGTRLGMWSHFTTQFGATVFALLWGFPFLVKGQGLSEATASALLVVMTATFVVTGPIIGRWVTHHPYYRSVLVLAVVGAIATAWAVVLLWPGRAPLWLLVVLVVVTATGGPGSMVGFDLARTFVPPELIGRASGIVNIGGFVAALATMGLIGLVLDWREPGGPAAYELDDFRVAMAVQFAFWGFGALQVWRYRRKALAHLARRHPGAIETLRAGEIPVLEHGRHDPGV